MRALVVAFALAGCVSGPLVAPPASPASSPAGSGSSSSHRLGFGPVPGGGFIPPTLPGGGTGGGGGGGTVTSVTAGTGLNGGTITTTGTIDLADTAITPGTYALPGSITFDQQGRATAATAFAGSDPGACTAGQADTHPALSAAGVLSKSCSVFVNAAGAGLSLSGSTLSLPNVGPGASSYTYSSFTIDTQGRVTAASSGTAPVTSISVTAPIASTGGTTPTLSLNESSNFRTSGSNLDLATAVSMPGSLVVQSLAGTPISPTAITGTNNDWAPTGLSTATTIRVNTSGTATITGITGGSADRELTLEFIGANPVTLANQITSTAANQIITGAGADLKFTTDMTATLRYDGTTQRWRVVSYTVPNGTGLVWSAGTLAVDSTVVQSRVSGTCADPFGIISIAAGGTVTCATTTASMATGTNNQTLKRTGTRTIGDAWAADDGTTWGVASKFTITEASGNTAVNGTLTADAGLRVFDTAGTGLTSSTNTVSLNINAGVTQTCGAGTVVNAITGVGITSCVSAATLGYASGTGTAGTITEWSNTTGGLVNSTFPITDTAGVLTLGNATTDATTVNGTATVIAGTSSAAAAIAGTAVTVDNAAAGNSYITIKAADGKNSGVVFNNVTGGAADGYLLYENAAAAGSRQMDFAVAGTQRLNITNTGAVITGTESVSGLSTLTGGFTLGADSSANSHKITSLTNGSAASDAAAFGQIASGVNAAVSVSNNVLAMGNGSHAVVDSPFTYDGSTMVSSSKDWLGRLVESTTPDATIPAFRSLRHTTAPGAPGTDHQYGFGMDSDGTENFNWYYFNGTSWSSAILKLTTGGNLTVPNGLVTAQMALTAGFSDAAGYYGVNIIDTTSAAQNDGGAIIFSGAYTGTTTTAAGVIKALKSNSVAGDYNYDLALGTRLNGGTDFTKDLLLEAGSTVTMLTQGLAVGGLYQGQVQDVADVFNSGPIRKNLAYLSDDLESGTLVKDSTWGVAGGVSTTTYATSTAINPPWYPSVITPLAGGIGKLTCANGAGSCSTYSSYYQTTETSTTTGIADVRSKTFTFSVWIQPAAGTMSAVLVALGRYNDGDGSNQVCPSATAGTWTRCSITRTFSATALTDNSEIRAYVYVGAAASLYVAGAQIELGSVPTAYEPNDATVSGTGYGQWAYQGRWGRTNEHPQATIDSSGNASFNGTLGVTGLSTLTGGFNASAASTITNSSATVRGLIVTSGTATGVTPFASLGGIIIDGANAYLNLTSTTSKGIIFSNASATNDGFIGYDNVAPRTMSLYAGGADQIDITSAAVTIKNVPLNMSSHLINNVTDPVSAQDAVTLNYLNNNPGSISGAYLGRQTFSSTGAYTYTPTTGTHKARVRICGAGGGGGGVTGSASNAAAGEGGTAGEYQDFFVDGGTSTLITGGAGSVGTGGTAGTTGGAAGGTGGDTTLTIQTVVRTSKGGIGGAGMTAGTSIATAQTVSDMSVSSTFGSFMTFAYGTPGIRLSGTVAVAGNGGSSPFGRGGHGHAAQGGGESGATGGAHCGGGGGGMSTAAAQTGGVGGDGLVIIDEWRLRMLLSDASPANDNTSRFQLPRFTRAPATGLADIRAAM